MKYYVATKEEANEYVLTEFDSLSSAYKFYLDDPSKRMVLKEVKPEVTEK